MSPSRRVSKHEHSLIALQHIAQYVRPLLGEAGEMQVQGEGKLLKDGFVGLVFLGQPEDTAVLFAQPITEGIQQSWVPNYQYPRKLPFVSELFSFKKDECVRWSTYTLTASDCKSKDIKEPLQYAFGSGASGISCRLVRCKFSDTAILYYALHPEIDEVFLEKLKARFIAQKNLFLLALVNAFFLSQATLPDDQDLAGWLHLLNHRLLLPEGFFDRFLKTQAEALADLQAPSTWLTHPFKAGNLKVPVLQPAPPRIPEWLKSIRGAKAITVERPLLGSLRGEPAYLVTLVPRTKGGLPAGEAYPAVVKRAPLKSVIKEHNGYLKLQQYFDSIRDEMPPLSVAWKCEDSTCPGEYAVVTPRVSGDTLSAYLRDRWESQWAFAGGRVNALLALLGDLLKFTQSISSASESPCIFNEYQPLINSHLGDRGEARRRFGKTKSALSFFLSEYQQQPLLQIGGIKIVNPLWLLHNHQPHWRKHRKERFLRTSCRHGDFHAGNILVTDRGRVTILDFDYVDEGFRFEDEATLEISFLLSVASSERFRNKRHWHKVFPGLLEALASQSDDGTPNKSVLSNPDAYDLWKLTQRIRHEVIQRRYYSCYYSLLATALLRLVTSFQRELVDPREYHPGAFSTAILYLGLILNRLIDLSFSKKEAQEVDLFLGYLQWPGMGLKHPFLRSLMKWVATDHEPLNFSPSRERITTRLQTLSTIHEFLSTSNDKASICRLALRILSAERELRRAIPSVEGDWKRRLAGHYAEQASANKNRSRRSQLSQWVRRYESPISSRPTSYTPSKGVYQAFGMPHIERRFGDWYLCGRSAGKPTQKDYNADAFTLMNSRSSKSFLVAVADGTGDSRDGARASSLALSTLRRVRNGHVTLADAIFQAHSELQTDNLVNRLDGACCIAALYSKGDGSFEVGIVGDTRFISSDSPLGRNYHVPEERFVLGGEPLGDIITSGGNLVRECELSKHVWVRCFKKLQRFALMSDGAFASEDGKDPLEAIETILATAKTPREAVDAILKRASAAFERGAKPDDVTVVVGWRTR